MFTAQDQLRAAVKEQVVLLLRAHGFKGTFPTWRRTGDRGDVAVVNIQFSSWNTRDRARIHVNLAVASDPWLDWDAVRFGRPRSKVVQENHGLWRDRLDPPPDWRHDWEVHDEASAQKVAIALAQQLNDVGLPTIVPLIDRSALLECLRTGSLGYMPRASYELYYEMALAVLLADDGPSAELARLTTSLQKRPAQVDSWPRQQALLMTWLAERAASAAPPA